MLSLFLIFVILAGVCAVSILLIIYLNDISIGSVIACSSLVAGIIVFSSLAITQVGNTTVTATTIMP